MKHGASPFAVHVDDEDNDKDVDKDVSGCPEALLPGALTRRLSACRPRLTLPPSSSSSTSSPSSLPTSHPPRPPTSVLLYPSASRPLLPRTFSSVRGSGATCTFHPRVTTSLSLAFDPRNTVLSRLEIESPRAISRPPESRGRSALLHGDSKTSPLPSHATRDHNGRDTIPNPRTGSRHTKRSERGYAPV